MKNVIKIFLLVGAALGALVWVLSQGTTKQETADLPKINQIKEFQLTDQNGNIFGFQELKGKVWAVNFVFTRCQGHCPLMTERMAELQNDFSRDKNVAFVTISMDARYDTPEVLKKFATKYEADFSRWHFLTGDPDKIIEIARSIFKVPADKDPEMHTTRLVLVDEKGFIRGYYDSLDTDSFAHLKKALHNLK